MFPSRHLITGASALIIQMTGLSRRAADVQLCRRQGTTVRVVAQSISRSGDDTLCLEKPVVRKKSLTGRSRAQLQLEVACPRCRRLDRRAGLELGRVVEMHQQALGAGKSDQSRTWRKIVRYSVATYNTLLKYMSPYAPK
jgi:hypothetical protein